MTSMREFVLMRGRTRCTLGCQPLGTVMRARSRSALATIRARIARRRRAGAEDRVRLDNANPSGQFGMAESRVRPRSYQTHAQRSVRDELAFVQGRSRVVASYATVAPAGAPRPALVAHQRELGAKVGSYLAVLTESNVRGTLRRKVRLAADRLPKPAAPAACGARTRPGGGEAGAQKSLRRWEDDGGSVSRGSMRL